MSENKNMRELSMDEMDKVSGGADGVYINGLYVSEEELYQTAHMLTNAVGYDNAADFLCQQYGISTNEKSKRGDYSDIQRIDLLVNRIIVIHSKDGKHF